jgi:hypothetical protein
MWQNRLNYSSSSALVIAIQLILIQRTLNGTTHCVCRVSARCNHGSTGSRQVYLARWRVYSRTTAHQLLIHRILNIITNHFQFQVVNKHCLKRQAKHACQVHNGGKFNTRLLTSRRLAPHLARSMASFRRVTASRGWIHSTDQPNGIEFWPCRTIRGVLKGHT